MRWFRRRLEARRALALDGGWLLVFRGADEKRRFYAVGAAGELAEELGWTLEETLARLLPLVGHDRDETAFTRREELRERQTDTLEAIDEVAASFHEVVELGEAVRHEGEEAFLEDPAEPPEAEEPGA